MRADGEARFLYSIGHSTHPLSRFLELMEQHEIKVLVDVRTTPFSRWAPHFSKKPLEKALTDSGITYLYFGKEMGGKPKNPAYYDEAGQVSHQLIAASAPFRDKLARLVELSARSRAAVMCGEEDPTACHRRLLVGSALAEHHVALRHIRGDGRLQSESDLKQPGGNSGSNVQLKLSL